MIASSVRRRGRCALWLVAVLAPLPAAGAARAGPSTSAGDPRTVPPAAFANHRRVTVAVIGDSLVENGYLSRPATDGLGSELRAALRRRGLDPGGSGFVPAHPATLASTTAPQAHWPVRYSGRWRSTTGPRAGAGSALASRSGQPRAAARVRLLGDAVAALVAPGDGSAGRVALRTQNARADVDTPLGSGLTLAWLAARGRPELRLRVIRGAITLVGFFARRRVAARRQVEVSVIARGGALAADPVGPLDRQGLARLRPELTIITLGTNDEIAAAFGIPGAEDRMAAGLAALARIATDSGRCVVAIPPVAPLTLGVAAAFAARMQAVATRAGCGVTRIWEHVLDAPGRRVADGLHPNREGVHAMAEALAPQLEPPPLLH